jgi:hypothetical protein
MDRSWPSPRVARADLRDGHCLSGDWSIPWLIIHTSVSRLLAIGAAMSLPAQIGFARRSMRQANPLS